MFIMQSHCHHLWFTSIEYLSKIYWNVMVCAPITSPSPMPLSTDVARWAVKGANVEIPSTCACMCQNLTWLDKTHAFTVWEGFKAQGCMSCPHNLWDCPCFHQCSSLSHCRHSPFPSTEFLSKLSWNVMERLPINEPITIAIIHWRRMLSSEWGNVEIPSTCAYMRWNLT